MNRGDRREPISAGDQDRQRLVVQGLKRLGSSEAGLRARRKGKPRKVTLARELRAKMALALVWIAERVWMAGRGHLAWLLQQLGASRLAAPTRQGLLRI